jgi:hypothetical protein
LNVLGDACSFGVAVPLDPVADLEGLIAQDEDPGDEVLDHVLGGEPKRERERPEKGREGPEHRAEADERRRDRERAEEGDRLRDRAAEAPYRSVEPAGIEGLLDEPDEDSPCEEVDNEEGEQEDQHLDREAEQGAAVLIDDLLEESLWIGRNARKRYRKLQEEPGETVQQCEDRRERHRSTGAIIGHVMNVVLTFPAGGWFGGRPRDEKNRAAGSTASDGSGFVREVRS